MSAASKKSNRKRPCPSMIIGKDMSDTNEHCSNNFAGSRAPAVGPDHRRGEWSRGAAGFVWRSPATPLPQHDMLSGVMLLWRRWDMNGLHGRTGSDLVRGVKVR